MKLTDTRTSKGYTGEAKALSIANHVMNNVCPSREWHEVSSIGLGQPTAAAWTRKSTDVHVFYSQNALQTSSRCLLMCLKHVRDQKEMESLFFILDLLTPAGTVIFLFTTSPPPKLYMGHRPP